MIDDKPYLVFFASRKIEKGEEVTYDYGDRDKKNLKNFPWLFPAKKSTTGKYYVI